MKSENFEEAPPGDISARPRKRSSAASGRGPIRVGILADREDGFVRPMAEGLRRMLSRAGARGDLLSDGLQALRQLPPRWSWRRDQGFVGAGKRAVRLVVDEVPSYLRFLGRLRRCDVIVVVDSVPRAFMRGIWQVERLRRSLPGKPIVLYDVFYLPTRGLWGQWLRQGNPQRGIPQGGNFGLERYDWYLCASVVSEIAMPPGPQPFSLIGLDLDDETLRPGRKDGFVALLDFEHPPDMIERAIQVLALEETKTKYAVLHGHYPMEEIRRIYRSASIFFLAMRESFGLPICEAQACGAYVFTPYAEWAPSHWIKEDLSVPGPGRLSPNFVVYGNDKETLKREIERVKESYDSETVFETFLAHHRQLFRGNIDELRSFVEMVQSGEIHGARHREHGTLPPAALPGKEFLSNWQ